MSEQLQPIVNDPLPSAEELLEKLVEVTELSEELLKQGNQAVIMSHIWHALFLDLCRRLGDDHKIIVDLKFDKPDANNPGYPHAIPRPLQTSGPDIDLAYHMPNFVAVWPEGFGPLPGWLLSHKPFNPVQPLGPEEAGTEATDAEA